MIRNLDDLNLKLSGKHLANKIIIITEDAMEVANMSENDSETFVLVKDANGENFLCPLDTVRNSSSINVDEIDNCVEEDVVGRYAGNIKITSL